MYNLLNDTNFKNYENTWILHNCYFDNGYLISTDKVFGIEQELVLPKLTRLYFRCNYYIQCSVDNVKIGIQNGNRLEVEQHIPKEKTMQTISVVSDNTSTKVKVHIIFESKTSGNKVLIQKPLLVDLRTLNRSTWLKFILDRTIHYLPGYNYINEYEFKELNPDIPDLLNTNVSKGKVGSIISVETEKIINISAKFNDNTYYLIKLDYENINEYGNIYLKYGTLKSKMINSQLYVVIRSYGDTPLELVIENKERLLYMVNLKHIMIVNLTRLCLQKDDIPYLPFI